MMKLDMRKCDILFISPSYNSVGVSARRLKSALPNQESAHIGIAYLLAMSEQLGIISDYINMAGGHFTEEEFLNIIETKNPSLIGVTSYTEQMTETDNLTKLIKKRFPDLLISLGGPHAFADPTAVLDEVANIDFIIRGEGEYLLKPILDADGDLKKLSAISGVITRESTDLSYTRIEDLDALPFPAWYRFDFEQIKGVYPHRTKLELPMVTGRGCPFKCTFCCRSLGDKVIQRSVDNVLAEIEDNIERYGCESIAFLDETFTVSRKWTTEFLDKMISRGLNKKITWSCSTRLDAVNQEILKRMREAGCYFIFYGLESANDETLARIRKSTNVKQIEDTILLTKQAGIIPVGAFIIGLEGTNEDEVHQAIALGKKLDLYSITFPLACPFPGTHLRDLALKNEFGLKVISNNWQDYGKQRPGVLESEEFPIERRREAQKYAYESFPKKDIDDYIQQMKELGYPF